MTTQGLVDRVAPKTRTNGELSVYVRPLEIHTRKKAVARLDHDSDVDGLSDGMLSSGI